jgi:NAD+ synthase
MRLLLVGTVAAERGYTADQVRRVYDDIDQKRRATAHLHAPPILLEPLDQLLRDRALPVAAGI